MAPPLLRQALYYLLFAVQCFVMGRRKPIVAGVPLTDACNLSCRHCVVANRGRGHHSFERIAGWMRLLYRRGARILYLQGGEAFGWKDGEKTLEDVIRLARRIGYFKVAVVTNGTYPLETEADLIWLSLDGTRPVHDLIRGEGVFDRVMANLNTSSHHRIYANLTVNGINRAEVDAVARIVALHPRLRGLSINFHTPYPGVEDLALSPRERAGVIERIVKLKKKGYPIVNSPAGLRFLKSGRYPRPAWMIQMVEQGEVFECCWGRKYDGVCERCGYGVIAELAGLAALKPAGALHALSLFGARSPVL